MQADEKCLRRWSGRECHKFGGLLCAGQDVIVSQT